MKPERWGEARGPRVKRHSPGGRGARGEWLKDWIVTSQVMLFVLP